MKSHPINLKQWQVEAIECGRLSAFCIPIKGTIYNCLDEIWCREKWNPKNYDNEETFKYAPGGDRSAQTMPRWASRFQFEITRVAIMQFSELGKDGRFANKIKKLGVLQSHILRMSDFGIHQDDAPFHTLKSIYFTNIDDDSPIIYLEVRRK